MVKVSFSLMNLTKLIKKLESQLNVAEKYARSYDAQANALRKKLYHVAEIVGERIEDVGHATARAGKRLTGKSRRGMSASGRARIIAAQKKRWAAYRAKNKSTTKSSAKTGRRRGPISAAGRARIAAAQRKRWAAQRKQKQPEKSAA